VCSYSGDEGTTGITRIANALKKNTALKVLSFTGGYISNLANLCPALRDNTTLEKLRLCDNGIVEIGGLGMVLSNTQDGAGLRKLRLCNNRIVDLCQFGEHLRTNRCLQQLRLEGNQITDISGLIGFLHHGNLSELRLGSNRITNLSSIFGEAMKNNSTLKILRLER
jgi:Leucine-rich repeat (LRR) protein